MSPLQPATPLRRRLAFSAVAVVGVLGAVELACRVVVAGIAQAEIEHWLIEEHLASGQLEHDALLGWRARTDVPCDQEVGCRTNLAAAGEHPGWRAIALGDSQTFGAGVRDDRTWPQVASRALGGQVINAGLSGYGSLQAYRLMRDVLPAHRPDLYLVDAQAFDQPRDEWVERPDHALGGVLFGLKTYYLLHYTISQRERQAAVAAFDPAETLPEDSHFTVDRRQAQYGNHAQIQALGAAQGVPVVFVNYPVFDPNVGVRCLLAPHHLPADALLVDVCPALGAVIGAGEVVFLDSRNHLNVRGYQVMGTAIAEQVTALGLGPG